MADVAALADVSTAVVSYVVNDGPRRVSEVTRVRVLSAIESLGYRPNRTARALASRTSGVLGLIVPSSSAEFFVQLVEEVEAVSFRANRLTLVGSTGFDSTKERRYFEAFADAGVDQLIVVSSELNGFEQRAAMPPVVWVHHRPVGATDSLVDVDNVLAGALATEHLLFHDPEQIVIMTGLNDVGPLADRLAGCRQALEAAGVAWGSVKVIRSAFDRVAAMNAVSVEEFGASVGVLVLTDEQAIGVSAALGARIGQEVSLVAIDGTSATSCLWPPITSVVVPIAAMAAWAVDHSCDDDRQHKRFGVSIRIGRSCGCGPA